MVLRVTVYGWAIPEDRFRGKGSGTFVDMVYLLDDSITYEEVFGIIEGSGFTMQPMRYQGQVVHDKVTIEEITVGMERVEQPPQEQPQGTIIRNEPPDRRNEGEGAI
jgi:hypothetical protein